MVTVEQKRRLGAFVIISSIILILILILLMYPKFKGRGEVYIIDFKNKSVNGLNVGSEVKYQGVRIGKVKRIEVNTNDLTSILVFVELNYDFPVKEDMSSTLQYAGITGLKYIEIEGGKNASKTLTPGSKIKVGRGFGEKAEDIVKNIDTAIRNINDLIGKENKKKVNLLLGNLEESSGIVKDVLNKKQENIGTVVENLENASEKLVKTVDNLNSFVSKLNTAIDGIKLDKLANNINGMVKNISDRFSDKEFGDLMENFDKLIKTTTVSVKKFESNAQKMEFDFRKAMEYLRESLGNITKFTRDLAEDPTSLLIKKNRSRRKR